MLPPRIADEQDREDHRERDRQRALDGAQDLAPGDREDGVDVTTDARPARAADGAERAGPARATVGGHATASSWIAQQLDVGLLEAGLADAQDRQRRADAGDERPGRWASGRRHGARRRVVVRAPARGATSSAASAGRSAASSTSVRSSSRRFSSSGVPIDRDLAVVDHADAVGLLGLVEVVGGEEDRRAVLRCGPRAGSPTGRAG